MERKKLNYLRPTISVCNVIEESLILAGSPNVKPGGGGQGGINVVPATPEVGENDDELIG